LRSPGRGGASRRWSYDLADPEPPPPPSSSSQLKGLMDYFGPWLGKWYWETVIQGAAKSTLWGRVQNIRGMKTLNALYGFNEQRLDGTEELSEAYNESMESTFGFASDAASALANPYNSGNGLVETDTESLNRQVIKLKVKISEMLFKGFTDRSEMPDMNELKTPVGEGNMVPVSGVPSAYRLHWRLSSLGKGGL